MSRFEESNNTTDRPPRDEASSRLLEDADHGASSSGKNKPDQNYLICESGVKSFDQLQQCANGLQDAWNTERVQAFVALKKQQDPEQAQTSKYANSKWLDFQALEYKSIDSIYNASDTKGKFFATLADADVRRDRAVELETRGFNDKNGSVWDRIKVPFSDEATYPERLSAAYEKIDAQLNKSYKHLMSHLDESGKSKLRDSERAWIKYRDAEFKSIDANTDFQYKGPRNYALAEKIDIVRARNANLQERLIYLDEIKR